MGLPANWLRARDYRACSKDQARSSKGLPLRPRRSVFWGHVSMSALRACLHPRVPSKHLGEKFSPHHQLKSERSVAVFVVFVVSPPTFFRLPPSFHPGMEFSYALWTSDRFEQIQRMPGSFLPKNLLNLHQKIWPGVLIQKMQLSLCCCC